MHTNRLERLPGQAIAPLKSPKNNQKPLIIRGYTEDRNIAWQFLMSFYVMSVLLFSMGHMFVFWRFVAPSFLAVPSYSTLLVIALVLVLGGYYFWCFWKNRQQLRLRFFQWVTGCEIQISDYPLQLGERYSFTCRQKLMPSKRLSTSAKWKIQLVCAEVVTYGYATNPSYARWIVHRETIYEQNLPIGASNQLVAQGRFTIPADGIPSFEASSNRVRWQIESKVEIEDEVQSNSSMQLNPNGSLTLTSSSYNPGATLEGWRRCMTRFTEFVLWVDPKK
jgi:hypothetical protein